MNKLFYQSLCESTDSEWELIIIDNNSTDGSREYFESLDDPRVKVIRNDANYSYPYCQNKGIEHASGDVYAFLNNDIRLSPHWDSRIMQVLGKDGYEIISVATNDHLPTPEMTHRVSRRFKRIKYPLLALFGSKRRVLKLIVRLTYGNWEKYCNKLWDKYHTKMIRGFSGSVIIMSRKGVEMFNGWDPSQQGADFDMYLMTSRRAEKNGDIKPLSIVCGVFVHHFRRLTFRTTYPPFADKKNLIPLEQKWTGEERRKYLNLME